MDENDAGSVLAITPYKKRLAIGFTKPRRILPSEGSSNRRSFLIPIKIRITTKKSRFLSKSTFLIYSYSTFETSKLYELVNWL